MPPRNFAWWTILEEGFPENFLSLQVGGEHEQGGGCYKGCLKMGGGDSHIGGGGYHL